MVFFGEKNNGFCWLALFVSLFVPRAYLATQTIELALQTGHYGEILDVKFSPDNRFIATSGGDGLVILWDVKTGKQIKSYFLHHGAVNAIDFHPSEPWMISVGDDHKMVLFEYPSGRIIHELNIFGQPVNNVAFSHNGSQLIALTDQVYKIEVADSLRIAQLSEITAKKSFSSLAISPGDEYVAVGGRLEKRLVVFNFENLAQKKTYNQDARDLTFGKYDEVLLGVGNFRFSKWRLGKSAPLGRAYKFGKPLTQDNYEVVAANDQNFMIGRSNGLIALYDLSTGKKLGTLSGHLGPITAFDLSNDGKTLVSVANDRFILFWDLEQQELLRPFYGFIDKVNALTFSGDGKKIFIGYLNGELKKWDLLNNNIVSNKIRLKKEDKETLFFNYEYILDSIKLFREEEKVMVFGRKTKRIKLGIHKESNNPFNKIFISLFPEKNVPHNFIWDVKNNVFQRLGKRDHEVLRDSYLEEPLKQVEMETVDVVGQRGFSFKKQGKLQYQKNTGHVGKVAQTMINPIYNIIATASWDGTIKLWNKINGELLMTLFAIGDRDFLYLNPENYYFVSKMGLEGVGLRIENQVFPLAQFDVLYNRPDLTLENLPIVSDSLLQSYRRLYEKRLDKSGFKPDEVQVHLESLPELKIINRDELPINANQKKVVLELTGNTKEVPLKRINIFINGVPAFGRNGISLENEEQFRFTKKIPIQLSNGNNRIQVSVTNQVGLQSIEEIIQLGYIPSGKQKDDLYIISIGVSNYLEERKNLDYATKDAKDFSELFQKIAGRYNQVHSYLLTDENFSPEKFNQVKQILSQSNIDDEVIIFYAGHGLLDDSLDFYLATYDVDFLNPSNGGLAYQELEQLLDDIPSRKKLLILDACHSGEIDKEEIQFTKTYEKGKVKLRNVSTLEGESSIGLQNSFDLMRTLFADMNRATGAHIISSAKGGEFAFESSDWDNGAFTYCLLDGLQSQKADLNGDKEIMFSELQQYLSVEVPKITDNRQQPTIRNENLLSDYRIW